MWKAAPRKASFPMCIFVSNQTTYVLKKPLGRKSVVILYSKDKQVLTGCKFHGAFFKCYSLTLFAISLDTEEGYVKLRPEKPVSRCLFFVSIQTTYVPKKPPGRKRAINEDFLEQLLLISGSEIIL